jgi:ABC-type transport system involved in cytochrome bd biosynthesis fused ATPase/permease subunit
MLIRTMSPASRSSFGLFSRRIVRLVVQEEQTTGSGRSLSIFLSATFLQSAANGVMATSAGLLGQALLSERGPPSLLAPASALTSPLVLSFVGFVAALVKTSAGALSMYGQRRTALRAGNAVRREITDAIVRCGQAPGAAAETHAALAIRLREVERGVDEGLFSAVRALLHLAPLACALVFLSSRLALLALLALLPFALALALIRRRFRAGHARASRLAEELHAGVDELVRHLDLWRTYGAGLQVQRTLDRAGEQAALASARADSARAALSGANEALAAGALLGAVLLVERAHLPLAQGSLVAFAAVFFLMYRPLRDLGDARAALERGAEALASLDQARAALEAAAPAGSTHAPLRKERPTAPWQPARLQVSQLAVIRGQNATPPTTFHLDPGEILALVGPTGAGKTSLLRALLGLEPGVSGTLSYGERDLLSAGVGPGERPFAWVPQEAAIITGTLDDNIALGASIDPAPSAAALLAQIGARSLLERGVDAPLRAGGHELSGGERQWIALARALRSGLPVLLLDEPTSGLDPASQARVLEALAALRGTRAMILVTHRPEPLAIADRVVRLGDDEGAPQN